MGKVWCGITVSGSDVTMVHGTLDAGGVFTLTSERILVMQGGPRPAAYAVIYSQVASVIVELGTEAVAVKASALPGRSATGALLEGAELRGVVQAACATHATVHALNKGALSRNFGTRKVDEYLKDEKFWDDNLAGKLRRKASREAVFMILAAQP